MNVHVCINGISRLENAKIQDSDPYGRQNSKILHISAHIPATKTKEKSISIMSRPGNRSLAMAIAWECNFLIWQSIWPPKQIISQLHSLHKNTIFSIIQGPGIDPS